MVGKNEYVPHDRRTDDPRPDNATPISRRQKVLRCLVYTSFWIVSRVMFRVRIRGLADSNDVPGAICIGHHKSDLDGLIALSTSYWRRRAGGPFARAVIVGGEHIFQPGFLSGYVVPRPRWLSFLLYPIHVGGIMRSMGWYPIPQSRRRYLLSHLLDILENLGNLPLSELFPDSPGNHLPGAPPTARIRDVLGWRYRRELFAYQEFSTFEPGIAEGLWQRQKERIASSLSLFSAKLDEGAALFMSPHGMLSTSGRMGQFKSGLFQIVQGATREVVLVPSALTYDVMCTGRKTVFWVLGAPLHGVKAWPREQLEEELHRAVALLTVVMLGHLASSALRARALEGGREVQEALLQAEVQERAQSMARDGFLVDDRLLKPGSYRRCWRRFLAYGEREGLVQRDNGTLRFAPECVLDASASETGRFKPWGVCANELDALIEARAAVPASVGK